MRVPFVLRPPKGKGPRKPMAAYNNREIFSAGPEFKHSIYQKNVLLAPKREVMVHEYASTLTALKIKLVSMKCNCIVIYLLVPKVPRKLLSSHMLEQRRARPM